MGIVEIILIAISLSIDASIVAFSYGLQENKNPKKTALSLALVTGFFQGFMPFISGVCTECVKYFIQPYAKSIVFAIFMYLGINFIKDAFDKEDSVKELTLATLLLIGIATSIDALSVGIPLSLRYSSIIMPVIIIAIITFVNAIIGFYFSKIFSRFEPKYLSILSGLILIGIAVKVLL